MQSCNYCGTANEDHATYCQSCGQLVQKVSPGAGVIYGGFWKRVLAWLIDGLIVSAATGVIAAVTWGIGLVAFFFGHWLYEAFMISSPWQATLGKRVLGLVVTDLDGRSISFARATGRHFAKWISGIALCIGFIMVAFTGRKQGLHDMIASTLVISR